MLYRALRGSAIDKRKEQDFRERNPDCPALIGAETFEKACLANAGRFFLVKY